MAYETDYWDVHASRGHAQGFVLLDARTPQSFEEGHVPGAVSLPHGKRSTSGIWPRTPPTRSSSSTATDRTVTALIARRHAWRLGRPVKKMIGGVEGWKDEGFRLVTADGT